MLLKKCQDLLFIDFKKPDRKNDILCGRKFTAGGKR